MSPPTTLRNICVKKTSELLTSGVWDRCEVNPFSSMPVSIVQELMSFIWSAESQFCRAHSRLLLTSGRLEHLVLPRAVQAKEYVTPLRMLLRGCQNLRTLSLFVQGCKVERSIDAEQALQELLQSSAKLEYLHSCVYFEPNALRDCSNLKTLKLHFDFKETETFFSGLTPDLLKRLKSIEVLALCKYPFRHNHACYPLISYIKVVLDNCPQLTSLGFLGFSTALQELHYHGVFGTPETPSTPRRFEMRRCFWESGRNNYESQYCDRIDVVTSYCPLVEFLVIEVPHAAGLQHLKVLKNLSCLHIDFNHCYHDYRQALYSFLDEVGPQLRHLCVMDSRHDETPLSSNVICGQCPNLSTLQLHCPMTADEGVQPCANLMRLEHLCVHEYDRRTLFFLLSNCLNLKVLCLDISVGLDDGAFQAILRENPFAELEVALIEGCSLSKSVLTRFVRSASKLTKCCLRSYLLDPGEEMRCVKVLNPSVVCYPSSYFSQLQNELLPPCVDTTCWL